MFSNSDIAVSIIPVLSKRVASIVLSQFLQVFSNLNNIHCIYVSFHIPKRG